MRRLRVFFGMLAAVGGAAGLYAVEHRAARGSSKHFVRVMDRRCRGGCSGALSKLLALGDAITKGVGLSPTYPSSLGSTLGYTAINAGNVGDTVAQMKTRYEASYHVVGQNKSCVFQGGGVDLITNGSTESATYTTAAALLDEMRADGCKPVVLLPTPSKYAAGWTIPRQSEQDIYRYALQAYCNTNAATTSCVETYGAMGSSGFAAYLPQLNGSYDSGDHFTVNQAGANALATLVSHSYVSGTPLYSSSSFPATVANPLPGNANTYCLVAKEKPSPTWSVTNAAGLISFGGFNAPGYVNFYRFGSAATTAGAWAVWMFDNTGAGTNVASTSVVGNYPLGFAAFSQTTVAFCANNGKGTFWTDGAASAPFTIPTNITLNGVLNTGSAAYGGASATTQSVCIAGPTGVVSTDVTLAVQNSCGQFASRNSWPVEGGVVPTGGAKVVMVTGDSITEKGGTVVRAWPMKYNALIGTGYNVINDGHSGWAVAQMKSNYDFNYHGNGTIQRCIILGGINDIIRDGATGAATYTAMAALLDEMRADGCKPIVVMPTPAKNSTLGWTSARQTEYDSYRSSLSSYCTTNAATTTCVDTYGAGPTGMGDGTSPPQLYSTYDPGDHTHPNQAGEDEIAAIVYAAVPAP